MKKTLFAIIACCMAASSAFAQITFETQLDNDKPLYEASIKDISDFEHGHIFIKINGEPDDQGRTPVQIELENTSYKYEFLLFDHSWSKKDLRKQLIYFEKGFGGESTLPVEKIDLDLSQSNLITSNSGIRYTFPDILVEEGKVYECKIPIHLAKPKPGLFCKKRKNLHSIISCTIRVSVDNKDEAYEKLKSECDSLIMAFNEALARQEFCTNPRHRPSFEAQTKPYTEANHELRDLIRRPLYDQNWPKDSKKYKQYQALLLSLDKMDDALEQYKGEKHDCGIHDKVHSCKYCKLSLEEIYRLLDKHYQKLYNGEVQKSEIIKEVEALYKCCKDPTCTQHAKQWKNNDPYKANIIEFYNKIKAWNE